MRAFTYLLTLSLLSGSLAAQIPQLSPAVTKFSAASSTAFAPPSFPSLGGAALGLTASGSASSTAINQLELRPIGGGGTFFRLALAAPGVPTNFGGVGGSDVVEGVFDPSTNVSQLSNLAAAFNTSGNEDTFSISEDGLVAVSSGANTMWSSRSAIGVVWPAPQPVAGIAGTVANAKLFTQGNQLKMAWNDTTGGGARAGNIWVGDFNNGVVSNAAILMSIAYVGRLGAKSPHPVTEEIPAGSGSYVVHGWTIARQWNALDSDTFWVPGADPTAGGTEPPQPQEVWNDSRLQGNGTSLGTSGTNYTISSQNNDPMELSMVALSGSTFSAAAGGTVHIRAMVPWSATDTWLTAIFLGPWISPVPVPLTIGNPLGQPGPTAPLGLLGISPIVTLQAPVSQANPGGVTYSFNIAAGSLPANMPIPMQLAAVNLTGGGIFLGNTAAIEGL